MPYLSLEEAAAQLGISTDQLVELRSQGQVRGFRDGSSWKFPDNEIDRLADDLAAGGFGSGILDKSSGMGDSGLGAIGSIIGGDSNQEGDGSDLNIGSEKLKEGSTGGSDVNLVPGGEKSGSDVALVASDSGEDLDAVDLGEDDSFDTDAGDLAEIDSAELSLEDSKFMIVDKDDKDSIDIAIDPKEGSTGPVAKKDIQDASDNLSVSDVDVEAGLSGNDLGLTEEDSDDLMIGDESEDSLDLDALSDDKLSVKPAGASSLELMKELDTSGDSAGSEPVKTSSGADVLSELDLLSKESSGSGLISGDSENLMTSSGLGSGLGSSVINELDDALDDDDDLVIADDDAELMLDSVSDISVAGDSGINLMSPSDSGLSLESEPLDLAGSSLSALDLGAELADGSDISGSGSGVAGGSALDFSSSDEEFQLSPSGMSGDGDIESSSQVIEVEDSEVVGDAVEFDDDFADPGGFDAGFAEAEPLDADAFDEGAAGGAVASGAAMDGDMMGDDAMIVDDTAVSPMGRSVMGYEVPFSLMQCLSLLFIILTLSLGGMLMTDLVRNMWAYNETSAPVNALTNSLISLMGWDT